MSDGHMLVNFAAVDQAAADTDAIAGQIGQELDSLKAYLAPLVATWTGQAAGDYHAVQAKWDQTAEQLNTVLHQMAAALRTAHQNYTSAETTNAGMWGLSL